MVRFLLLDENATSGQLSLLQSLLDNRQKQSMESRLMKMGREHAWVQPDHFYVIAMEGEYPLGFVFCSMHRDRIVVNSYYTHSKYRHKNVATQLTFRLMALARKQGMKRVVIPNALEPILRMAERMQKNPRHYLSHSPRSRAILPERFRIGSRSIEIHLRSSDQLRRAAGRLSRSKAH